jgi:hypothetical protein
MRFWGLIQRRLLTLFPSYRPERHYMRGPGPKWRERHGPPARRTHCMTNAVGPTSRQYDNEICVVPRLSAQTVIRYNE